MTDLHPITPPPELVQQWAAVNGTHYEDLATLCGHVATQAARWGADQRGAATEAEFQEARDEELEACSAWLHSQSLIGGADQLRAARRPKPLTLKEQALADLDALAEDLFRNGMGFGTAVIRRVLEALPE
jgi:hypothetical protein